MAAPPSMGIVIDRAAARGQRDEARPVDGRRVDGDEVGIVLSRRQHDRRSPRERRLHQKSWVSERRGPVDRGRVDGDAIGSRPRHVRVDRQQAAVAVDARPATGHRASRRVGGRNVDEPPSSAAPPSPFSPPVPDGGAAAVCGGGEQPPATLHRMNRAASAPANARHTIAPSVRDEDAPVKRRGRTCSSGRFQHSRSPHHSPRRIFETS